MQAVGRLLKGRVELERPAEVGGGVRGVAEPFADEAAGRERTGGVGIERDGAVGVGQRVYVFAGAVADYSRAIALSPNAALAYYNRAWAHYLAGENIDALADADRAIALNARSATAFSTRGLIRERLGDTTNAAADFRKALEIDPAFQQPADGLQRLKSASGAAR